MRHPVFAAVLLVAGLVISGALAWQHFNPTPGAAPAPASAATQLEPVQLEQVWASTLPDLTGQTQTLAQWRGKVVVLNFWAPWCPPCREEIPGFVELQTEFGAQGLQFVGVAMDDPEKVQAFADENSINYPTLLGDMQAYELGKAAGNRLGGLPYTLILDRQGQPVATLTGGLSKDRLSGLITPLL